MIESILNKTLFIVFYMSIFNIILHIWAIIRRLRQTEIPEKYELKDNQLVFLGLSISYVLMTIFEGIRI